MENDKIGIFVPEHHGDIALCTAVLKYREQLWPGKKIVWYCNLTPDKATYLDMLNHNDAIDEIRQWPMADFRTLKDQNSQLLLSRRADFDNISDLHNGYFPAPWAALPNPALDSTHYAEIPRIVFGVDPSLPWRPYLGFSDEEREQAKEFCKSLPYGKTVMLETQLRSAGNFILDEEIIVDIMNRCRAKFGKCNFIFASKLDYSKFFDTGVVSCSDFTVRQCALIHDYCDLFIGVCSGITMACSCWGAKPVPRVELCGTTIRSGVISNGPVNSVICDNWSREKMKTGFPLGVQDTLNKL